MKEPFISICIPNYNRPENLYQLLKTVDSIHFDDIEIVICEDFSPKRNEIRKKVKEFKNKSKYSVNYLENKENLGYDENLKELIRNARGKWIVFMGDDDEFVPGALDKMINFLKENDDLRYVLRRHYTLHRNGKIEDFRYYKGTQFFEAGSKTFIDLFRKSVFISGFTIRRDSILSYLIDDFNGTALFQIYLLGEIILKYKSAYFDEPFTREILLTDYRKKELLYDREKGAYVSRPVSIENSIRFLSGYAKLIDFFDRKYNFNIGQAIRRDMSKYFYPSLSIHRDKGALSFLKYIKQVNQLGFNVTIYYYFYIFFLLIFGKKFCDNGIRIIKNILGKTPKL